MVGCFGTTSENLEVGHLFTRSFCFRTFVCRSQHDTEGGEKKEEAGTLLPGVSISIPRNTEESSQNIRTALS